MKKFLLFRSTWFAAGVCIGITVMFFIATIVINLVGVKTYETITTGPGLIALLILFVMIVFATAALSQMFRNQNEQNRPQQHNN